MEKASGKQGNPLLVAGGGAPEGAGTVGAAGGGGGAITEPSEALLVPLDTGVEAILLRIAGV